MQYEPTPEQIEAAYQAWLNFPHKRGPQNAETAIRAALVAAAGAAPQELTARVVGVSYEASPSCSQGVCPKGCSHLMWTCKACSCEGGWGSDRTLLEDLAAKHACPTDDRHPMQVDEAKLAKLIAEASVDYNLSDRSGESHACGAPDYRSVYIAREVAEWLRGGAQ